LTVRFVWYKFYTKSNWLASFGRPVSGGRACLEGTMGRDLTPSRLTSACCTLVFGGVSAAIGWHAGHLLAHAPASGELPFGLSDGDLLGAAAVAAVAFSAVLLNLAAQAWRGDLSPRISPAIDQRR
jgi:hypothetical protein